MKVFKRIIAGVVVGVLTLALATSAFAATVTTDGMVKAEGFTASSGNMTVMVVSADAYDAQVAGEGTISADDICYIDQDTGANVLAKITNGMLSINLKHGDYYVVTGGITASASQKSDKIATISVEKATAEGKALTWVVKAKPEFVTAGLTAKFYNTADGAEKTETEAVDLEWAAEGEPSDYIITGEGTVEFEVYTKIQDAQYVNTTELEIASGEVSNRN